MRPIRQRLQPREYKEFYVQEAIDRSEADAYLEIGVRNGHSFRAVRAPFKVAVDPERTAWMQNLKAGESFFESTSDLFFEKEAPVLLKNEPLAACLVDGLHTFEQSLRDVINASAWMAVDGTIVLDDCFPRSEERASLEPTGGAWNGDVWKTIAVLKETQPHWDVRTLDVDEGVGLITGLSAPFRNIAADQLTFFKNLNFRSLADDPALIGLRARQ